MYYNNISKKLTNNEYRFKTEKEFENEYGENWRYSMPSDIGWVDSMNYLFGIDLDKKLIRLDCGVFSGNVEYGFPYFKIRNGNYTTYNITMDMLTKNNVILDYNTPKKLIYEKKNFEYGNIIFKCNTIDDLITIQKIAFLNEFVWYNITEDGNLPIDQIRKYDINDGIYIAFDTNEMDMLNNTGNINRIKYELGNSIENAIIDIYGEDVILVNNINKFRVLFGNIIDYNKPKQLVYESKVITNYYNIITKQRTIYPFRFKTEKEFEKEFGERWWNHIDAGWNHNNDEGIYCMNYLLGTDLESELTKEEIIREFDNDYDLHDYDEKFDISRDMIVENDNGINYNTPKQLVYEELNNSTKYDVIIIKLMHTDDDDDDDDDDEFINIQRFLFEKGYKWVGGYGRLKMDLGDREYILAKYGKDITSLTYDEDNIEYMNNEYKNNIYVNGLSELKQLFDIRIDYNTPKQLVYEGRINFKYKYRFKTETEFIDEFGENWKWNGNTGWSTSGDMDYLFGKEIEPIYYEELLDKNGKLNVNGDRRLFSYQGWSIYTKMIKIPIEPEYNTPKQLIYENILTKTYYNTITKKNTTYPYRFRTEKEFEDDYDINWRSLVGWNDIGAMDYLFGKDFNYDMTKEYIDRQRGREFFLTDYESGYIDGDDQWMISKNMLIKNDNGINYNTPRQLVYENKILKYNKYNK